MSTDSSKYMYITIQGEPHSSITGIVLKLIGFLTILLLILPYFLEYFCSNSKFPISYKELNDMSIWDQLKEVYKYIFKK